MKTQLRKSLLTVNDKPKREFHDSVNDYWNKEVDRDIKYFKLLNEKMK